MTNSVHSILKKYGDIISTGAGLLEQKKKVFSVSPSIDLSLGGGIPEGSFVSFAGPPGCGKSTTVLQIIANVLKQENYINGSPRKVFYEDVEHRLKKMNMEGVSGLDPSLISHIHSTVNRILTGNDYLDIGESLIKDPENVGCLLVVDSSSALCPTDEMTHETSGSIRGVLPKMLSHWCKKMAAPMKVMDGTIIFIQHLITNTSGYGEKWLTDGGEKIKYHFDIKLITKGKPEKWIEKDVHVGQIIEWEVIKSANCQSGLTAKSYLRYGYGLDSVKENLVLAVDFGIVQKSGSWYAFEGEKFQGEDKLLISMRANPELYKILSDKVKEISI